MEAKHKNFTGPCVGCKTNTTHYGIETESLLITLCSSCSGVFRYLKQPKEGLADVKQLRVSYPPAMSGDEVRCVSCNCKIELDIETGRAICKEPTCRTSRRLDIKSGRERRLEKERTEILKRIGTELIDSNSFGEDDQKRLREIKQELLEAAR